MIVGKNKGMRFTSCSVETLGQEVTYPNTEDAAQDLETYRTTFPFEEFVVEEKREDSND